jgi:hypothetical protein
MSRKANQAADVVLRLEVDSFPHPPAGPTTHPAVPLVYGRDANAGGVRGYIGTDVPGAAKAEVGLSRARR